MGEPQLHKKNVPAPKVIDAFLKLPEKKRIEILRKNLSDEAVYALGELEFATFLSRDVKRRPDNEIRAYLTDSKNFGAPWQDLIACGEDIAGGHVDSIYTRFHVDRDKPEEKLYALFMCNDLSNRLRVFWEGVKGEPKKEFEEKGMLSIKNPAFAARFFKDDRNFAPGKSFSTIAEEVMNAADLSKETTIMEHLHGAVPQDDPDREEKLSRAAQYNMVLEEPVADPGKTARALQGDDWDTALDPQKILKDKYAVNDIHFNLPERIKQAVDDIPETAEDKAIFQNAALQTCKDIMRTFKKEDLEASNVKGIVEYRKELQEQIVKRDLDKQESKDIRAALGEEYRTLSKEKRGLFLSKTNSKEYNTMMDGLRRFNAKLDLINTGKLPEGLSEEDEQAVRNTDVETLFKNAKSGCYNYGCLKTNNGTSGIIHDSGSERFNSSMNTLKGLNALGKQLHLGEPADAVRSEAQREVLQNRRKPEWMAKNAGKCAAKLIYAQSLLKNGTPACTQERLLKENALNAKIEKLQSNASFKEMTQRAKPEGVSDAIIKGSANLAALYGSAVTAAQSKGHERTGSEIAPADIEDTPDSAGLSAPVKK